MQYFKRNVTEAQESVSRTEHSVMTPPTPSLLEDRVPGSWPAHSVFPWAQSSKARRQRKRGTTTTTTTITNNNNNNSDNNNNHNRLVRETDRETEA